MQILIFDNLERCNRQIVIGKWKEKAIHSVLMYFNLRYRFLLQKEIVFLNVQYFSDNKVENLSS